MSDQTSIFGNDPTATQPQAAQATAAPNVQPPDPVNTLLASVKNERGEQKYNSLSDAINGLKHAQEYIPTLKSELSAKEQALAAALARAAELEAANQTLLTLTTPQTQPSPQAAPPVFDESKIAEMVQQTLSQREQQAAAQKNTQTVVSTLQQVFGADAEKAYNDKASELGMTVAELNSIASKSPQAVFNMLGIKPQKGKPNVAPLQGTVNPAAYQPKTNSFIGRNEKSMMLGATTEEIRAEFYNARSMVDEVHAQGFNVSDLSDPKVYNKFFNRKY